MSYHALALLLGTEFNSVPVSVTRPHSRTRDAGYPYAIVKDLLTDETSQTRFSKSPRLQQTLGRTSSRIVQWRSHGADGDRTHDLRLAKPALSQLSYSPVEGDGPR